MRLGRITVPGGGEHLIAPRVHHQRCVADPELLPTPATVADVGGSGGTEIAEPSIEVPGGVGQQ